MLFTSTVEKCDRDNRRLLFEDENSSFTDFDEFGSFDDIIDFSEETETENDDGLRHLAPEDKKSRGFGINVIIEAKVDLERPKGSMLTLEHFKEIQRFEQWLMNLEYSDVPGIPYGTKRVPEFPNQRLAYTEPQKTFTYYDLCKKQNNIKVKYWPEDTPENCKLFPAFCPTIKPDIKPRCVA